ncbi:MAG: glycosyltransferase family 4 protein [Bacteroidetes bacterium]|nr:glycosyltransferase family 4 protein [Bacteroidota bacterium]
MRVLMFGWEFPPHISGGLGTACYGLTRGLLQNMVDLIFVVPKAFGDEDTSRFKLISAANTIVKNESTYTDILSEQFVSYGINSLVVPYHTADEFQRYTEEYQSSSTTREDVFAPAKYSFTGQYGRNLMSEVWDYAKVAAEIAINNQFDIIHTHDWLAFPAGIIAKALTGKPLIAHIHATEYDRSGENINEEVFEIEKMGLDAADKIIAVSEYTKAILVNKYKVPWDKVVVIYNAIEELPEIIERKPPEKVMKEKIITYLGRVTYQKGPEYFVEAASKILSHNDNYRFVMAGSGDMLNRMIKKVAELRISSHFHFTGFLKGSDVNKMLSMSDVYVMPSVSEPFGISPLEALRADVPVVISKQSGVREVLGNTIALDFWDTDAMANAIHALAQYKGLSKMFLRNGKIQLKKLKWENQAQKVKDLYESLV